MSALNIAISLLLILISLAALIDCGQKEETKKKQAWISFCNNLADDSKNADCPYFKNAMAIPIATSLKRRANGTLNAVEANFILQSFIGIGELDEKMTLQGTFVFTWEMPECATWPEAKGGESPNYCSFKRDDMWRPIFYHANALGDISPFDNFPFDVQTCSIIIRWQRLGDSQNVAIWPKLILSEGAFSDTDEWQLLESKAVNYYFDGSRQVEYWLKFERRPQSYTGTIFLPMILLMIVQSSVYFIPAEEGGRNGFSITVFLSSAVLLTLVSQYIPATAERLGIIILFGCLTALGTVITVYTAITDRMATHFEETFRGHKIKLRWLRNYQCPLMTLIDAIAFVVTVVIYAILCLVILGLMITNATYSPFYTEPPPEIIVQNDTVHRELGDAAAKGRIEDVKRLLQLPGIDVNWWDERRFSDCGFPAAINPTALRRAVACNQTKIVELLLANGARLNETDADRQSDTLLINAILNDNMKMTLTLLDYNASVVQLKTDSPIFNAMAAAAFTGNLEIADVLVHRHCSFSDTNSTGSTITMIAIERGNDDFYNTYGQNEGARDKSNNNALIYAARSNSSNKYADFLWIKSDPDNRKLFMKEVCLYGKSDLFERSKKFEPPPKYRSDSLFEALRGINRGFKGNHSKIVELLLEMSISGVNQAFGDDKTTALMLAANSTLVNVTRQLLDYGAATTQKDSDGWTPFFYAASNSNFETLQLFVDEYGDTFSSSMKDKYQLTPFYYAASNCDSRIARWLFFEAISNETERELLLETVDQDDHRYTPLMQAAASGCLENVEFMLTNVTKFDVMKDSVNDTDSPHGVALLSGNFEIARLMLEKYPEKTVNYTMNAVHYIHPLQFAAYLGTNNTYGGNSSSLFDLLLKHDVDVHNRSGYGYSALMFAIIGRDPFRTVPALLQRGVHVDATTRYSWTALMFAAIRGSPTVTQLLLDAGADVTTGYDLTPAVIAAAFGHVQTVRLLLQRNATIYGANVVTETALMNAVEMSRTELQFVSDSFKLKIHDESSLWLVDEQKIDEKGAIEAKALLERHLAALQQT